MRLTKRKQESHIMSKEEKEQYSIIIRRMPWLYEPILEAIGKFAKNSKILMDIACGDGYLLRLINQKHPHLKLFGMDADSYFIRKAKSQYSFKFTIKDANKIKGKYDVITLNLSVHHFDNPSGLIKKLYKHVTKALIISDQIRPRTEEELERRLEKRKQFIKKKGVRDVPFYKKNEQRSILEAYSKKEIKEILSSLNLPFTIKFIDRDYYQRFVAIFRE